MPPSLANPDTCFVSVPIHSHKVPLMMALIGQNHSFAQGCDTPVHPYFDNHRHLYMLYFIFQQSIKL